MEFVEHIYMMVMMAIMKPLVLFLSGVGDRYFFLYIATGLLLAWWADGAIRAKGDKRSFWERLTDREVWWGQSVRNDYLIIIINGFLLFLFMNSFVSMFSVIGDYVVAFFRMLGVEGQATGSTALLAGAALTIALFLVRDFFHYLIHWLQHVNPVLWEFHKIHHSAERLNFFTPDRAHPIDIMVFAIGKIMALAVVNGVFIALFGPHLSVVSIMGANIFVIVGNVVGGALRHSPFALGYGEKLERWLISPAMHHIHHSEEERHFDRNMGGTLCIWDRMFGTWMPSEPNYAYRYGLGDEKEMAIFRSPLGLYFHPFVQVMEKAGLKIPGPIGQGTTKEGATGSMADAKGGAVIWSGLSTWLLVPAAAIFLMAIGSLDPFSSARGKTGGTTPTSDIPLSEPVRQLVKEGLDKRKPSVFLEDLTFAELRYLMDQGVDRVLIPIGGTEQNGLHMALGKHNLIVRETAARIAEKTGKMVVAPVMRYVPEGDIASKQGHMAFSGTLSVRPSIFEAFLSEAVYSLKQHGFRKIYLLGDSGSTQGSQKRVAKKLNKRWKGQGVQIVHLSDYYAASGQKAFLQKQGVSLQEIGSHAGIRNSSELLFMAPQALRPAMLDLLKKRPENAGNSGHSGDPWKARKAWGEKLIELKVDAAIRQIRAMKAQG